MEQLQPILFNIFIVLTTASVVVLIYCLRQNKSDFDLFSFILTNKNRFLLGNLLGILISILIVISQDIELLLNSIGFDSQKTPVAIGLALGAVLIAGVSGNKES